MLSIVAGMAVAPPRGLPPDSAVVVRAMPNTPALVGRRGDRHVRGGGATAADLDWAESVLRAVGMVVRLPERYLDAVTGVSACGPAYLYLVAEAMIDAGVTVGLTRDLSRTLVAETMLGTARLMVETGGGHPRRSAPRSPPRAGPRRPGCGRSSSEGCAQLSSRRWSQPASGPSNLGR